MFISQVRNYSAPPLCVKEILRYASCKEEDAAVTSLLSSCIAEAESKTQYKVCFQLLPLKIEDDLCSFGEFDFKSKKLAANLSGCDEVVVFAASLGIEFDRLISKYSRLSPARALMLQALGTERIEALCDLFCEEIAEEMSRFSCPRFSPGYGDLDLSAQKAIFSLLDCRKKIGVALNESLLISPSKSVTAIMGLCKNGEKVKTNKCSLCSKADCQFRCI